MSLREDVNRSDYSDNVERRDSEQPRRVDVGPLSLFISPFDRLELINSAICRIFLLMVMMTRTSIPPRHYSWMNLRILKSGLLSLTPTIP
jgi:hypothetical protein